MTAPWNQPDLFSPVLKESGSCLRRMSALPKVVIVVCFLIFAVSLSRYDWRGAAAFAVLPFLAARLSRVPCRPLLVRTAAALPFILCAGIANCFFDRRLQEVAPGVEFSGGVVALAVLVLKTAGTVGAVLLLTTVTPIQELSGALVRLHVPCILILQIQLLCRYLGVILEEAHTMKNSYLLRNPQSRVIPFRDWGILIGRLFLRSVKRAEEIYQAMQCRLFHAGRPLKAASPGTTGEWSMTFLFILIFAAMRYFL